MNDKELILRMARCLLRIERTGALMCLEPLQDEVRGLVDEAHAHIMDIVTYPEGVVPPHEGVNKRIELTDRVRSKML